MLFVWQPAVSLTPGVPWGPGTLASLGKSQDFTGEVHMQQSKRAVYQTHVRTLPSQNLAFWSIRGKAQRKDLPSKVSERF